MTAFTVRFKGQVICTKSHFEKKTKTNPQKQKRRKRRKKKFTGHATCTPPFLTNVTGAAYYPGQSDRTRLAVKVILDIGICSYCGFQGQSDKTRYDACDCMP